MTVENYVRLHRGSAASERVPADVVAVSPAEAAGCQADGHDRIIQALDDILAHRLLTAGLDLHVALGLISQDRAAGLIRRAIGRLDQVIREVHAVGYDLSQGGQ